jgi:accessory gene regulator B
MPISNQLIVFLINKIEQLNTYSQDDISKIKYSLQSIFYEIEKIIIIGVIFVLLHRVDYYFITLVVLLSIRMNSGGFHNKTVWGCLLFTFLMFFTAINIFPSLYIHIHIQYLIATISLFITILLSPVLSLQKQNIFKGSTTKKKILSSVITTLWLMIFFYINNRYTVAVLGIILLQNCQLLYEYLKRRIRSWNLQKENLQ